MKHVKIIGFFLVIALIGVVAAWYAFNGIEIFGHNLPPRMENVTQIQLQYLGPAGSSDITFNGEFPDNPSKMRVYIVVPHDTEKDAQQIAKQLGVNEE